MKFLLVLFFTLTTLVLNAQNISAVYAVKLLHPVGFTLDYEGMFYATESQSSQYLVPLYLEENPDGIIYHNDKMQIVSTDPVQEYIVINLDSAIERSSFNNRNYYNTFEFGYILWEIYPEIRYINGLKCQRATWRRKKDAPPLGEVWFTPDVPTTLGIIGLHGVPGLIVELKWGSDYSASLISYDLISPIPEGVFWPNIFNKPFKFNGHIKKKFE